MHSLCERDSDFSQAQNFAGESGVKRSCIGEHDCRSAFREVYPTLFNLYLMPECIPAGVLHNLICRRGGPGCDYGPLLLCYYCLCVEIFTRHADVYGRPKYSTLRARPCQWTWLWSSAFRDGRYLQSTSNGRLAGWRMCLGR